MGFIRKTISFILILGAITAIVGVSVAGGVAFDSFVQTLSPFDFLEMAKELNNLIIGDLGPAFILLMIGFIGLSMPNSNK